MDSATQFCSSCCSMRPNEDFNTKKNGKMNKTCKRHSKKRELPAIDTWDDFIYELNTWSTPVLNHSCN